MNIIRSFPRNHNVISSVIITRRVNIHESPTDWVKTTSPLPDVGEVCVVDFGKV